MPIESVSPRAPSFNWRRYSSLESIRDSTDFNASRRDVRYSNFVASRSDTLMEFSRRVYFRIRGSTNK